MVMPNLKIYKNNCVTGYDSKEIDKWMKNHGYGPDWIAYSNGNTCGLIKGHVIIYIDDVRRFLEGKPNLN